MIDCFVNNIRHKITPEKKNDFPTRTNNGTIVKCVPQDQIIDIKSYPSRDLFSPLSSVYYVNAFKRCFSFKFL